MYPPPPGREGRIKSEMLLNYDTIRRNIIVNFSVLPHLLLVVVGMCYLSFKPLRKWTALRLKGRRLEYGGSRGRACELSHMGKPSRVQVTVRHIAQLQTLQLQTRGEYCTRINLPHNRSVVKLKVWLYACHIAGQAHRVCLLIVARNQLSAASCFCRQIMVAYHVLFSALQSSTGWLPLGPSIF